MPCRCSLANDPCVAMAHRKGKRAEPDPAPEKPYDDFDAPRSLIQLVGQYPVTVSAFAWASASFPPSPFLPLSLDSSGLRVSANPSRHLGQPRRRFRQHLRHAFHEARTFPSTPRFQCVPSLMSLSLVRRSRTGYFGGATRQISLVAARMAACRGRGGFVDSRTSHGVSSLSVSKLLFDLDTCWSRARLC